LRGFLKLTHIDIGVDTNDLISARVDLPYSKYSNLKRAAVMEDFVTRFNRPDRPTTFAFAAPMQGTWQMPLQLQDRNLADATGKLPDGSTLPVGNEYFTMMNIKIVRGRNFEAWDGRSGQEAVIVNQRFAETYWPSQDPLGKRLRVGGAGFNLTPWLTVVGVSANVFQNGNVQTGKPGPAVYVPYRLNPGGLTAVILVRSAQTEATVRELRAELAKIDPDLAPFAIMTFDEVRRLSMWGMRFFGSLIGVLSLMALVMASVGLYGVTAHGVNQRTREFGIRSALGAL
jgi:putative ABC transport system permease protein